jgi:hypothetical protein
MKRRRSKDAWPGNVRKSKAGEAKRVRRPAVNRPTPIAMTRPRQIKKTSVKALVKASAIPADTQEGGAVGLTSSDWRITGGFSSRRIKSKRAPGALAWGRLRMTEPEPSVRSRCTGPWSTETSRVVRGVVADPTLSRIRG